MVVRPECELLATPSSYIVPAETLAFAFKSSACCPRFLTHYQSFASHGTCKVLLPSARMARLLHRGAYPPTVCRCQNRASPAWPLNQKTASPPSWPKLVYLIQLVSSRLSSVRVGGHAPYRTAHIDCNTRRLEPSGARPFCLPQPLGKYSTGNGFLMVPERFILHLVPTSSNKSHVHYCSFYPTTTTE